MNTKIESLQFILQNRQNSFGTFCRISDKSSDLSLACQSEPMIDAQLMSARAIINTPCEDREGDIIIPKGVHLENFTKNPVVLWEHGLSEITHPIAKCQHPDGNLAIEVEENQILATSYFTDKSLESLQIFHLIAEGLVRATSVRAVPIKSTTRKTSNNGIGIVLEEWELIEWSWGALGVNPDAIARTVEQGKIEGRNISSPLLKSLKSILSPRNPTITGWTKSTKNRSQTKTDEESVTTDHEVGEILNENNYINSPVNRIEKIDLGQPDPNSDDERIKSKNNSTEVEGLKKEKTIDAPLGAKLLMLIQSSITDLTKHINSDSKILENESVKTFLNSFLRSLKNEQIALEKCYTSNYSHLNKLIDSDEERQFDHDTFTRTSEKSLKSETIRQLQKSDYYDRLKVVSQSGNLTPHQRQLLTEILKQISPTRHRQLSYDEMVLERNVEALSRTVLELNRKLSDLLPA